MLKTVHKITEIDVWGIKENCTIMTCDLIRLGATSNVYHVFSSYRRDCDIVISTPAHPPTHGEGFMGEWEMVLEEEKWL